MRNMKSRNKVYWFVATALLGSCTSDNSTGLLPGGTPVEVCLSFAVAGSAGPQVDVSGASAVSTSQNVLSGTDEISTVSSSASNVTFSAGRKSSSAASSPLQVSYTAPATSAKLRSGTSLSNVWVLQFDSTLTTGATTTAGACVAAKYIGTVTTGDNLNPTFFTGTDQVIYIIANGPEAGSITTNSYTLETFKSSAYFSGSITSDSNVPYIGRIAGGATIEANGEVYSAASTPTVTLYRIAAKISLTLSYAVSGYTLSSVQMFNAPTYMYYLYGTGISAFPVTPSSSNITTTGTTADSIPSTSASGTYTWYVGENKRGTSSTATSAYLKDFLHTPTDNNSYYYCTYLRIQAKKNDSTAVMNYYLYVGENGTTDFNVKRNWDYTLSATIGGNEAAQQAYMGIDGRIRMATSNCYIVAPGSTITIPVNVKGNANGPLPADASSTVLAGTGLDAFQTTAATTVSVLWQTASGLITMGTLNTTTQTVTLTASSSTGNGVIVAKDASSNVLWSWHIWVTDYNPKTGTTYNFNTNNPLTFMDRNLGATTATAGTVTSYGLHYQWGRKDPFPNASTLTGTTDPTLYGAQTTITKTLLAENTVCNLGLSILNPLTFYYTTTDHSNIAKDWYTTTDNDTRSYQNDALWGNALYTGSPTTKTIFDPCPAGWRVPTWKSSVSPWGVFGTSTFDGSVTVEESGGLWPTDNYGITWTSPYNAGFYPAAGCREVNGEISVVGSLGSYWSASLASCYGLRLRFASGTVKSFTVHSRSIGFSVRCVQE
jgi:hypothetical protein